MRGRRLWLIFAALCCLPLAVFLLSLDLFGEYGSGEAEQVDLVMGDQRVRADRAYSKWADYPVGAHVEEVRYRALMPNMRSKYDAEPPIAFDQPDKDEIVVTLQRVARPWDRRSTVEHIRALQTHGDGAAGLDLYVTDFDDLPVRDLFYRLSKDGAVDWFAECDKPEEEDAPACIAVERRFSTVGVSYTFSRTWLTSWPDIRRDVFDFVSGRLLPKP